MLTDKEKFYKLGLNILNEDYMELLYIDGKIYQYTVNVRGDKLSLNLTSTGRIFYEYRKFYTGELLFYVYEEDPSNIDDLIDYIKKRTCNSEDILDGLI